MQRGRNTTVAAIIMLAAIIFVAARGGGNLLEMSLVAGSAAVIGWIAGFVWGINLAHQRISDQVHHSTERWGM